MKWLARRDDARKGPRSAQAAPLEELAFDNVGPRVGPRHAPQGVRTGRRSQASAGGWYGRVFQGEDKVRRGGSPESFDSGSPTGRTVKISLPARADSQGHDGLRERPTTRFQLSVCHGPLAGTERPSL
jgi:hypothetical protein